MWLQEGDQDLELGDTEDEHLQSEGLRDSEERFAFEPSSIPTLRQVKARARVARGREHQVARLRQRLLQQFDIKEELKRRFRHTRATDDRSLLISAQEDYIRTKEELASFLRETKSRAD